MPKHIQDVDSLKYKKQLAEFMATINPKPSKEMLEKLLHRYDAERNAYASKR